MDIHVPSDFHHCLQTNGKHTDLYAENIVLYR